MNTTQARAKLREAIAAVADATQEVQDAREAVAIGEATAKDVSRATRALERAQDRAEQARVDLQVVERREQAEAEANAREAARIRSELDKITRAKQAAEVARYAEYLGAMRATVRGFNDRLAAFSRDLREYGTGIVPSRWESYGALLQAIDDQERHMPATRAKEG